MIGADGVHVGTVDHVENGKIKLTKADSGEGRHQGHHHFIDLGTRRRGGRGEGKAFGECGGRRHHGRRKPLSKL